MRNAETILGIVLDHWRADLRSKDSRAVRRGAVGKVLYRATRRQPTLLHEPFLGEGATATPPSYPTRRKSQSSFFSSDLEILSSEVQSMNSTIPADLHELETRFETWRKNRKYLRAPIPDELWKIAIGHHRSPRAQSRPNANIGQVRIRLDSLCHAAPPQGDEFSVIRAPSGNELTASNQKSIPV